MLRTRRLSLGAGLLLDQGLKRFGLRERTEAFATVENGKPCLLHHPEIQFNLSHSGSMVMAAFSSCPVGCDVEKKQKARMDVAKRFFAPAEQRTLLAARTEEERDILFSRLWTLKESYLKVGGQGMAMALGSFAITLGGAAGPGWNERKPVLFSGVFSTGLLRLRMRAAQGSREGGDVFFLFSKPGRYGMIPIEFKKETYDHMDMKRVFLKLSGEALAGPKKTGFDEDTVKEVARQVKISVDAGVQVGIVIGGGNFWRGRTSETDRAYKSRIRSVCLLRIMNCIYVSEIFRSVGMMTSVLTPFECGSITKLYSKDRANKYFAHNMVVFFAGGTGHPYFSTDTATVLRAVEIEADGIYLAKAIDGVYDSDPKSKSIR